MRIVVGKRIKIPRIFIKRARTRGASAAAQKTETKLPGLFLLPERLTLHLAECISGAIEFPWPSPSDSPIVEPPPTPQRSYDEERERERSFEERIVRGSICEPLELTAE